MRRRVLRFSLRQRFDWGRFAFWLAIIGLFGWAASTIALLIIHRN